jgi:hypothetical protein
MYNNGENILILEIERLGMDMHRLLVYISTDMMSMRLSCIEIATYCKNIAGLQHKFKLHVYESFVLNSCTFLYHSTSFKFQFVKQKKPYQVTINQPKLCTMKNCKVREPHNTKKRRLVNVQ